MKIIPLCSSALISLSLIFLTALPANSQTATFYANSFVGRKMTNGQRYYHSNFTAAHPWLPLGSKVRVTSRKNKSVVVTITDRCGCSIDLAKNAWLRLGYPESKGAIPVTITRLR